MPNFKDMKKEDRVALYVSGGLHVALIAFFLLYTFSTSVSLRPSYMTVQIGRFKLGTQAQHADVKHKKVATTPNPSEKQPEKPQPKQPKTKPETKSTNKEVKPVHSPEQKEDVESEVLKTPDTKKVDPEKKTTEKKENKKTEEVKKTTKKDVQKAIIPPKARKSKEQKEGAKTSGSRKGDTGKVDADQGTGSQKEKSAPYNLDLQGISRNPVVQPLPQNMSNYDATVTLRFEVTPQGHVINIIPLHRSGNPELDQEVINTLKKWRFSNLPSKAPQENQVGTITFHFVLH